MTTAKRMNTAKAAEYLNVSKSQMEHWRITGEGPRYSQNGREIEYDEADCDAWRESRKISSRAEYLARKQSEKTAKLQSAIPKTCHPKPRKRQLKPRTPSESNNDHSFSDQAQ